MKTNLSFYYIHTVIGKNLLSLKTSNFNYIEEEYRQPAHIGRLAEIIFFEDLNENEHSTVWIEIYKS
jgi:hypothetical protein